jgi:Sulfotransferase family
MCHTRTPPRPMWQTGPMTEPSDSGNSSSSDVERPKVIYVMGAGHSGSTILGVALGNCEDCVYAGEVDEWLAQSGSAGWGGAERTRFWKDVSAKVTVKAKDLFGGEANRYIERSSVLFRADRWPKRRLMLPLYRRVAEELYCAIASTAEATHIVDTSHFPLRARELQRLSGIELYLVFLVRDPQSVVASNVRNIRRRDVAARRLRIVTTNAGLWLTQLVSVLVFSRHPRGRRMFVRHEQFLTDPEAVLQQILDVLDSPAALPDLTALRPGFALEGNRLIISDVITLKRSTVTTARRSLLTAVLQRPWGPILSRLRPAVDDSLAREPSSSTAGSRA